MAQIANRRGHPLGRRPALMRLRPVADRHDAQQPGREDAYDVREAVDKFIPVDRAIVPHKIAVAHKDNAAGPARTTNRFSTRQNGTASVGCPPCSTGKCRLAAVRIPTLLLPILIAVASGGSKASPDAVPVPVPDTRQELAKPAADRDRPMQDDAALIAEARQFVADATRSSASCTSTRRVAEWANQTDITPEHEAAAREGRRSNGQRHHAPHQGDRASSMPILGKLDPDTQRQLLLLKFAGQPAPDDPAQAEELAKIAAEMTSIYGKGKVCDPKGKKAIDEAAAKVDAAKDAKGKDRRARRRMIEGRGKKDCKDIDALSKVLQKSRKPDELLAAWKGWHDNVGKAERPLFARYVELANAGARGVGFEDIASMWRSRLRHARGQFEAETDRLWGQVKPLYDAAALLRAARASTRVRRQGPAEDRPDPGAPARQHVGAGLGLPLQGARAVQGRRADRRHADRSRRSTTRRRW